MARTKVHTVHSHIRMLMHPDSLKQAIDRSTAKVRQIALLTRVDAIAVRGISGAAVGFAVASNVGLPVILVRKEVDDSHSRAAKDGGLVESTGSLEVENNTIRYVIVDDFIENGGTITNIVNSIKNAFADRTEIDMQTGAETTITTFTECVGVVLYSDWVQYSHDRTDGQEYQFENGMKLPMYATTPVEEVF